MTSYMSWPTKPTKSVTRTEKKTIGNSHVLTALKELDIDEYIERLEAMYGCELNLQEKEDEIANKMKFKKKRKHKYDNIDEDLVKEQERLFNDAHNFFLQAQVTLPNQQLILEKTKSAPLQPVTLLENGASHSEVLLELEKRLSEKPSDIPDFDALKARS
eukprot:TRINITY_DN162_c0_g1_i9.p1 TRINITY_DN162_c0_g1~~TRINITY_DN162_c0_g1_i9.p1  ORF type:complete len:160 (-),score=36.48 TRINITY_DN162_c0_g1_i9:14-493(-)